jgi:hypothetical protein
VPRALLGDVAELLVACTNTISLQITLSGDVAEFVHPQRDGESSRTVTRITPHARSPRESPGPLPAKRTPALIAQMLVCSHSETWDSYKLRASWPRSR